MRFSNQSIILKLLFSLAHGTFIGTLRLESQKPTQLQIDARFHFGASTRQYVLREKPPTIISRPIMEELERSTSDREGGLLGLPETDTELDVSTYNNTVFIYRFGSVVLILFQIIFENSCNVKFISRVQIV